MPKTLMESLAASRISRAANVKRENRRLIAKWEKTGLLRGVKKENKKGDLSRLLENQAESLFEATTMSGGNIEGFATVVFPMVRRIFGDMIAENLISVQTMSQPTGLAFYLDFIYGTEPYSDRLGFKTGQSIYGGGRVGAGITQGVNLDNTGGFYDMIQGFSSPIISDTVEFVAAPPADDKIATDPWTPALPAPPIDDAISVADIIANDLQDEVNWDVTVLNPPNGAVWYYRRYVAKINATDFARFDFDQYVASYITNAAAPAVGMFGATAELYKALTTIDKTNRLLYFTMRATVQADLQVAVVPAGKQAVVSFPINDKFKAGTSLGTVMGEDWHFEGPDTRSGFESFPEIEIKLNSIEIFAETKKLKAKWTPELGQDLQAYHNIDAEVELSGILSDHIEQEIDKMILADLIQQGTAAKFHWDRRPGVFLNPVTGAVLTSPPDFTGPVHAWYETLVERMNDLSAIIHRKTLRGGANWIVCAPEMGALLEAVNGFAVTPGGADSYVSEMGVHKVGSISKKLDVYVTPYFPRHMILIGRKGSSNLESGYVYAPYVPITLFQTIMGPEDFVPRKGVMTRFARKMLRPDYFGLVLVHSMQYGY